MVIWPALLLVSGLIHCPATSAQTISTSSKPSGSECGSDDPVPKCIVSATCALTGNCVCPAGNFGEGEFHCYPEGHVRSEISGSNTSLFNLASTSADLYWPCRTRFTEVKTTRTSDPSTTCHFQVFALNKIIGGRVATAGFEVHFRIEDDPSIPSGIGIRKEGIADHGTFTFVEWGRDGFVLEANVTDTDDSFDPDKPYEETDGSGSGDDSFTTYYNSYSFIDDTEDDSEDWAAPESLSIGPGQVVKTSVDNDNFAYVDVPDCGVGVYFRPPDEQHRDSAQTPGLAVSIDDMNEPMFPNSDTYVSESPSDNTISTLSFENGLSTSLEVLHRTMVNAAEQPKTEAGEECAATARTYRSVCPSDTDRRLALASCSFFLSDPELIICMETETDGTGHNSLNAFKLCVWNSCTGSSAVCSLLKDRVDTRGCSAYTPDFFQSMSC